MGEQSTQDGATPPAPRAGSATPSNTSGPASPRTDPAPSASANAPGGTGRASVGQLFERVTEQATRLIKAELALAKAELSVKLKHSGIGIGLFAGAAAIALYGIGFVFYTVLEALDTYFWRWGAALITTVLMFAIAGLLGFLGKRQLERGNPPVPEQAIEGLKQDVATIKEGFRP